jgi:leader peptidase (prepilin peptidase) / N-methyltransferase
MITAIENVPVFSWLWQRGRCRHCGAGISWRYPLAELATGVLFAAAVAKFDVSLTAFAYAAFFWVLVVLTVIDLEHKLLPNRIVYPSFIVGWVVLTIDALVDSAPERLGDAALGALMFGGFFMIMGFIYPAGMGGGDIKLAFVLGTFLGYIDAPAVVVVGMFLSFFFGGLGSFAVIAFAGGGRKKQIPFGPFLAAGTIAAILFGRQIADWYLRGV